MFLSSANSTREFDIFSCRYQLEYPLHSRHVSKIAKLTNLRAQTRKKVWSLDLSAMIIAPLDV